MTKIDEDINLYYQIILVHINCNIMSVKKCVTNRSFRGVTRCTELNYFGTHHSTEEEQLIHLNVRSKDRFC